MSARFFAAPGHHHVRGTGTILLAAVLFGTMAACVRIASAEMSPVQIAFARFSGSLVLLLAVAGTARMSVRPHNPRALLLRGLLGSLAILFYFTGISKAGAAFATLLQNTYPVFTALFASVALGERFSPTLAAALVLDLVGVAIAILPGLRIPGGASVALRAFSSLAAAAFAGAAVTAARYLRHSEDAMAITLYFMAIGAAVTAPALLLPLPRITPRLGLALAGTILTSSAGQWLLHQGLGYAPAIQGSLAAATSVVTAAAIGAVALGERLPTRILLGACLLFAAVAVAVRTPTEPGSPSG